MDYLHLPCLQLISMSVNQEFLNDIRFGEKSLTGTGGMESKVKSSLWALDNGCGVVICNGMKYNTIRKIMRGQKVGSFFTKAEPDTVPVEILAKNARKGSRRLQSLSPTERAEIITNIGDSLTRRTDEIININRLASYSNCRSLLTGFPSVFYPRKALF